MEIKTVDINSIFIDPANARKHPQKNMDAIKGSISKFQQVEPLVVQKSKKIIIGGNGRYQAMKELGFKEVQIVEVDLTDTQAAALAISLNRTGELAEWDLDVLPDLLLSLQEEDFDLGSIGFDEDDLNAFISEEIEEGKTDPDAVPENVETRCKPGDLWILGNHRLLCGDSTNVQHVERLMNGEKADMVFTDPPYGIKYDDTKHKSNKKYKASNFGMIHGDDHSFVFKEFEWLPQTEQIWWGANYYCQQLPEGGSWYVWDKKTETMQDNGMLFTNDFEIAWSKSKHKQEICRKIWAGAINKEKGETRLHPTQKPISLIEWFFERIKAESVLDLFLGSGSTLIACEKTGRKCYGMEIDPHYCDVIIKRWEDFTGQTAVLYIDESAF